MLITYYFSFLTKALFERLENRSLDFFGEFKKIDLIVPRVTS
jgi:hypothetical protein|tara:strand:- start:461 stop:586 length:126 start_codon:yes stop_codon:yes gene_type:complete